MSIHLFQEEFFMMVGKFFNLVGQVFNRIGKNDISRLNGINMINIDGNKRRFNMVKKTLLLLPDSVLNLIREKEVSIYYTKNEELLTTSRFVAAGLYSAQNNYIYILDDGDMHLEWQKTTLIHEIGHFIDFNLAEDVQWLSHGSLDLHEVAYESAGLYNRKYGESAEYYFENIKETFAQGFAEFIRDRKTFEERCEHQSSFFEGVLAKIELHYNLV